MKKFNSNKVLMVVNLIIGALLISHALSIILWHKALNEASQVTILLVAGLMFFEDARDELLKSENEENE